MARRGRLAGAPGWGWVAGVAFFLLESGLKLARGHTTAQIRRRAAVLDEAGPAVLPLALLAAVASVGVVSHEAARPDGVHPALALLTVALAVILAVGLLGGG